MATRWAWDTARRPAPCRPLPDGQGQQAGQQLATAIWGIYDESAYEDLLDILAGAVADYVEQNPDLRTIQTEDMWDYRTDEDDDWEDEEDY